MNKAASIKSRLRRALNGRGAGQTATIAQVGDNGASIAMGAWTLDLTFSDLNDDGDPATQPEQDAIFSSLQQIVTEHNAAV